MRVCLVSLDYKPYRSSGLATYAEDLARGLQEGGLRVTVLAARRPGLPRRHQVDEVEVYRAPIDGLDWISYAFRAARPLRNLERLDPFDVVHFLDVHFAYAYRGLYVASLWQSFRQRLTAHHGGPYHTGREDYLRRQAYYRLARQAMEIPSLARAARLIASCRATRAEFIAHYAIQPGAVDLAVQGIDTERFRPLPAAGLRRRLGLADKRVLLFVGFITPRKGLEYLAAALRLLPPDVHLVVIGRWDPRYRVQVLQTLGPARDRLHDLGYIADADLPRYYAMADVYVAPSLLEGLGITPIEAMSCGTPAVVTSASSGPEEVGRDGLIVPPCDPPALAAALSRLLEDDALRRELGRRGRQRVLRRFSYSRMAALTLETYCRVQGSGD